MSGGIDSLGAVAATAASGMRAQGDRLRVTAENVANAETRGTTPGADPYVRKLVSFEEMIDQSTGAALVRVGDPRMDPAPFGLEHDPSHPAADEAGYVKTPNVDPILEMANMREASRGYEANMNMFETARRMRDQMLDLLR
ncbi:flagellar basal body rod protein FlgC [Pseudoroseicyclus aestuarii]|uniref:Flagellar basal-body rod protein FlgC n=1 Tax=Pseudoroseicyclus aestuarii TaxID=1795041 RepID=A0A318SVV0_9RHOB|nr:flagellar basal body rod protein FlgC [Pseudoroseicyclus aestuarii]PYE84499.1 flagellar basal-body rod protein FlgC [Pseudoroseicyclus aestuarii]